MQPRVKRTNELGAVGLKSPLVVEDFGDGVSGVKRGSNVHASDRRTRSDASTLAAPNVMQ
jgi:hypothetical protein